MDPYLIMVLIGLPITIAWNYFKQNRHLSNISLKRYTDKDLEEVIKQVLNFHAVTQNVTKLPKFKCVDLTNSDAPYGDTTPLALYDYPTKLLMVDIVEMRKRGGRIKDLIYIISHEWQHYVDHLNGITYQTAGMEVCEARADEFEIKGGREVIKNLVF